MKLFPTKTIKRIILFTGILLVVILFLNIKKCNPTSTKKTTISNRSLKKPTHTYTKAFYLTSDVKPNIFSTSQQVEHIKIALLKGQDWDVQFFDYFGTLFDTALHQFNRQNIYLYDIIGHATPGHFSNWPLSKVIREINKKCKLDTNTIIYLNGCNTGLAQFNYIDTKYSSAQILANETGCIVYGSRGFLTGTAAQNNEQCYPSDKQVDYRYPNAVRDSGDNVWFRFIPVNINKHSKVALRAFNDTYKIDTKINLFPSLVDNIKDKKIDSRTDKRWYNMFPDMILDYGNQKYVFYNSNSILHIENTNEIYSIKPGSIEKIFEKLKIER